MTSDQLIIANDLSVGDIAATYAIYFTFLTISVVMILSIFLCCIVGCCKDDKSSNKNKYFKKRFDLIKYNNIHTSDRSAIIGIIRASNQELSDDTEQNLDDDTTEKMFGIDKTLAKEIEMRTQKNKKKSGFFGCCRSRCSGSHDKKTDEPGTDSNDVIKKEYPNISDDKNKRDVAKASIIIKENTIDNTEKKDDGTDKTKPLLGPASQSPHSDSFNESLKEALKEDVDVDKVAQIMSEASEPKKSVTDNSKKIDNKPVSKLDIKLDSKIYLHYSFDNMNNDDDSGANTVLANINDDSQNVFRDLEAFVNIILRTVDPKEVVILLKISSPGGYAYKFELAYTHLMRLRSAGFQLVALVDDMCASGGYMLASACNTIVCAEYANIGSIGVVASMYNYYELIKKIGVVEKTLTTGAYKRPFPTGEPLEQQHTDRVNESIQEALEIFRDIVQKSRNLSDDEMKDVLSAKVWYGKRALEKKLVDRICSSSEYLDELIASKNQVFLVCRKPSKDKSSFVQSLLELSVPVFLSYVPSILAKLPDPSQLLKYAKIDRHKKFNNRREVEFSTYDYLDNIV